MRISSPGILISNLNSIIITPSTLSIGLVSTMLTNFNCFLSLCVSLKCGDRIGSAQNISAYMGSKLAGKVVGTFVRGNLVYQGGKHAPAACGVPILAASQPI